MYFYIEFLLWQIALYFDFELPKISWFFFMKRDGKII